MPRERSAPSGAVGRRAAARAGVIQRAPCGVASKVLAALGLAAAASSCAPTEVPDWETFYRLQPKSVLVLPVENRSTEVEAPRFFLATIAKPFIERGYYVFPVEATSEILASEGFTAGAELESIAPQRFGKYFGADAVLHVTIQRWDTSYALISSAVTVTIEYRLVDTRSGQTVWGIVSTAERRSRASGGDPLAALIAAAVDAAITAALTDYVPLAREANSRAIGRLVPGPYDPQYEATKSRLIGEWREYQRYKSQARAGKQPGG